LSVLVDAVLPDVAEAIDMPCLFVPADIMQNATSVLIALNPRVPRALEGISTSDG